MTNFSDLSNSLADAVAAASKSVVTVRAERPVSGTVIGDGLVLTVAHIVHADELSVVTADGHELSASVMGRDPSSDLALLKVDGLDAPALSASPGPRLGELLLAVGRPPRGFQVSLGMKERELSAHGPERGWLASGAAPFRGVSGGALVDARGGLVGVLNAGIRRGELLAVPAEHALKVAAQLEHTGRVPRGYLGIATQPVHLPGQAQAGEPDRERRARGRGGPHGRGGPDRRGPHGREEAWRRGGPERWGWGAGPHRDTERGGRMGLTVVQVEENSPAASAGIKLGDILLALDGAELRHPGELLERVRDHAGATLSARILRGGEEQDVQLTLGER